MLFDNSIVIEDTAGNGVYNFYVTGHLGSYPKAFFAPFKDADAFIEKDDLVGFKTNLKEALLNMENAVAILDGSETDEEYGLNVKDGIQSIIHDIRNKDFPLDYTIALYYGSFGDLMNIEDVRKMIPDIFSARN